MFWTIQIFMLNEKKKLTSLEIFIIKFDLLTFLTKKKFKLLILQILLLTFSLLQKISIKNIYLSSKIKNIIINIIFN